MRGGWRLGRGVVGCPLPPPLLWHGAQHEPTETTPACTADTVTKQNITKRSNRMWIPFKSGFLAGHVKVFVLVGLCSIIPQAGTCWEVC